MEDIRTQLQEIEARLRDKRAELARAKKLSEQAKASYAENDSDGAYQAAQGAAEAVKTVQNEIEAAQDEQVNLLRRLGDAEQGRSGWAFSGANGWADAARRLDLAHGEMRVDLAGGALLQRPMAAVNVDDLSGSGARSHSATSSRPRAG